MTKLLSLLLLCVLLSSCVRVSDGIPDSDYRFEVTCGNCTISIKTGDNTQSYNVYGYQTIPYNHRLPIITVLLWTNYDKDHTRVGFTGSGYNRTLFNDYLYYDDPARVIQLNL
ncbi:hypothetical protein [Pedobacter cryoconitis]|uniref:Lipoprotein n=1 Tax=Pedobacter cryoconitis TaxID=188932 RepID=A0A7X0MK37_9SPHI|nr:hypothetical protein [Pedobacter cryoconitis]MBB6501784.1 hypothetical protein [Pedobacter cryoconitis]